MPYFRSWRSGSKEIIVADNTNLYYKYERRGWGLCYYYRAKGQRSPVKQGRRVFFII